ncbi:MAG: DNA double-strand break repair nuclease NurA [Chloroflexi bacterium]|nr:DNA double-strand break repair nuclease NurA [Chloroflexota bacterium]
MALDLAQIAAQLSQRLPGLQRAAAQRAAQRDQALRALHGDPLAWEALRESLEQRRAVLSFTLPARLLEDPASHARPPALPQEFAVLATDGSQIELDRHAPLPCYVLNLGEVALRYGPGAGARLSSRATLRLAGRLESVDPAGGEEAQEQRERVQLELERAVAEVRALANLVREEASSSFTLALLDGSLILWTAAAGRDQQTADAYLAQYLGHLAELAELAHSRPLALASYISAPRSAEVVNALRAAFCAPNVSYCQANCHDPKGRLCEEHVDLLADRDLFGWLEEGSRSALFASEPRIMQRYLPPENRVHFFYVNVGAEVARVEVPAWVAQDQRLLGLTHAAVYDQCRRNFGYPVALMEAHQQAVVSEADRRAFWQLVYQQLAHAGQPVDGSAKGQSKRLPWA